MELAFFAFFAGVAAITGLAVVLVRSAVHSALYLIVNLFCLAVLFLTLGAEFVAAVQVLVYAGAIMVLFLFVITLLNPGREEWGEVLEGRRVLAALLGLALLAELVLLLTANVGGMVHPPFPTTPHPEGTRQLGNTQAVGRLLFTDFLFPFEVTSVLLLVALVGAVVLARRKV